MFGWRENGQSAECVQKEGQAKRGLAALRAGFLEMIAGSNVAQHGEHDLLCANVRHWGRIAALGRDVL